VPASRLDPSRCVHERSFWPATSIFIPAASTSWTCTKTSEPPPSGAIKPYPRSALKNLTRPLGMPLVPSHTAPRPAACKRGRERLVHEHWDAIEAAALINRGELSGDGSAGRNNAGQRRSYALAIAWPIVVCVSIQAQAAALVRNGPASECSAPPRDTPTKKRGTSCAPAHSYMTNLMNSFKGGTVIAPSAGQDRSSRSAPVGYARRGADSRR